MGEHVCNVQKFEYLIKMRVDNREFLFYAEKELTGACADILHQFTDQIALPQNLTHPNLCDSILYITLIQNFNQQKRDPEVPFSVSNRTD